MRDFRDAKTMAQTLRDNLTAKAVTISHSESLELVSRMLGVADWNTLSAMLKTEQDRPRSAPHLNGSTTYPAVPLRDFVPFPGMTFPLFVGRDKTMHALEAAYARQLDIVLTVQKEFEVDEPGSDDVHLVGLLAKPLEAVRLPDTTLKVLTQVERRVAIRRFTGESGTFQADIADLSETAISDAQGLIQATIKCFETYAAKRELRVHPATRAVIDQSSDPGRIADIIASYLVLPLRDKRALLGTVDPIARLEKINALLDGAAPPPRSAELTQTVGLALAYASRRRHAQATLEHFLLALTDDKDAAAVMQGCGVDLAALRENLDHYVETAFDKLSDATTEAKPTAAFQRVIQSAAMQAWENGDKVVTGTDCLVQLFAEWKSPAVQQLAAQRMTQKHALDFVKRGIVKPR